MPVLSESIIIFCESQAYYVYLLLFNHSILDPLDENTNIVSSNKSTRPKPIHLHFVSNSRFGDNSKYLQTQEVKTLLQLARNINGRQEILLHFQLWPTLILSPNECNPTQSWQPNYNQVNVKTPNQNNAPSLSLDRPFSSLSFPSHLMPSLNLPCPWYMLCSLKLQ